MLFSVLLNFLAELGLSPMHLPSLLTVTTSISRHWLHPVETTSLWLTICAGPWSPTISFNKYSSYHYHYTKNWDTRRSRIHHRVTRHVTCLASSTKRFSQGPIIGLALASADNYNHMQNKLSSYLREAYRREREKRRDSECSHKESKKDPLG